MNMYPLPPATPSLDTILFPPIAPYMTGTLKVDDIHTLYFEQSGNPTGVPVVLLHGGPGGATNPAQRQFFDPSHYRIILFDQRGCGKSTPLGELKNNSTEHLVADMEALREHLGIRRWHLFGGSWGSTLALAYAVAHADKVMSMTLRGVFMMRQVELDWFTNQVRLFFPEVYDGMLSFLKPEERADPVSAYYRYLTDADENLRRAAGASWSGFECALSRLIPRPTLPHAADSNPDMDVTISRMETHYFIHCRFAPDDYLLQNTDKIRHIPTVIVQGRYDMVCPPLSAYELAQKMDDVDLVMVPDAGHSSSEIGTATALVRAMSKFKDIPAF